MQIFFKPSFIRDFNKLPFETRKEVYLICMEIFPKLKNLRDFQKYPVKPLTGFPYYYRITVGDFRIGFKKAKEGHIEFMRVKHRKDIYKYFP